MADAPSGERGGFGRGFGGRGRGRGDRGRGRGRGRRDEGEEKWVPTTKLGRLVQQVGPAVGLRALTRFAASYASKLDLPSEGQSISCCSKCSQQISAGGWMASGCHGGGCSSRFSLDRRTS